MNSADFVKKACEIAEKYKTVYGWGTFGWPWNQAALDRVAKQYPGFYTAAKKKELSPFLNKGYFSFDCVGLIKGILWGWNGDMGKTYGGAAYASSGVPDIDANAMLNRCSGISADFSKIEPGEAVWLQGHIGIYIGGGKVVECTPAWTNGVQITALGNIGPIAGLKSRSWAKHGKLPWVKYAAAPSGGALTAGSVVIITGDKYSGGVNIPSWVKGMSHVVSKISGDKALLGADGGINSWVPVKDLKKA